MLILAIVKNNRIGVIETDGKISLPMVEKIGVKNSRFLFCIDDIGIYELLEDYEKINIPNDGQPHIDSVTSGIANLFIPG